MFPLLNPYGHVAFQAQRGDVHTVLVNGRVVKHEHALVGIDLAAVRRDGRADGRAPAVQRSARRRGPPGMNPEIPETKILDNPYTYTEFRTGATHGH